MWETKRMENTSEESTLIGAIGHLHLEDRNAGNAVLSLAGFIRRMARLNFSTIIVLPLLVGPTISKFGIRVRFGNVNRSSMAESAASARP